MLDQLTANDFSLYVGATLSVGEPALELIEVTRLHAAPALPGVTACREPFSLLFLARTSGYLPQGVYVLSHEHLGDLEVFLVPVGRTTDGALLEAVFN